MDDKVGTKVELAGREGAWMAKRVVKERSN
jgi:hypothetical protein